MNQEIVTRKINDIDIPRLEEFYRRVWPDIYMYKFPERNNWIIKLNPFIPKDFGYPIWISEINGKIVGHTSALIIPYFIENKNVFASTSVDTIVDNEYRGLRIGQVLQLNNRNSNKLFVSIGIAPINKYIKAKQGNTEGSTAFNLFFFFKIDKKAIVETICQKVFEKNDLLGKIIKGSKILFQFANLLQFRLKSKISSLKYSNELIFIEVESFDSRFDEIWSKCRKRYDLAAERTKEYLTWKYVLVPDLNYKKYLITNNEDNIGVLIYREGNENENNILLVGELYFTEHNKSWYVETFQFLISTFRNTNISSINLLTAEKDVAEWAIVSGFKHINDVIPMYYYSEKTSKPFNKMKTLITRGESDLDQIGMLYQPFLKQLIKKAFKI